MTRTWPAAFALSTIALVAPAAQAPTPSQPQTQGAPSQSRPQTNPPSTPTDRATAPQTLSEGVVTAPPTRSIADSEQGTSLVLLEHIQKVLDDAAKSGTGTVTIDRGMLDAIRAEVAQVRQSLQK